MITDLSENSGIRLSFLGSEVLRMEAHACLQVRIHVITRQTSPSPESDSRNSIPRYSMHMIVVIIVTARVADRITVTRIHITDSRHHITGFRHKHMRVRFRARR